MCYKEKKLPCNNYYFDKITQNIYILSKIKYTIGTGGIVRKRSNTMTRHKVKEKTLYRHFCVYISLILILSLFSLIFVTSVYLHEDSDYGYFEAKTTGLPTFTIVGGGFVEISEESGDAGVPWIIIIGGIISTIVLLVAILFKGKYIYFQKSEKIVKHT